eukprot:11423304-Alexandrium_andersonii.AAC.1
MPGRLRGLGGAPLRDGKNHANAVRCSVPGCVGGLRRVRSVATPSPRCGLAHWAGHARSN